MKLLGTSNLIPTEFWDYSVSDLFHATIAALRNPKRQETLPIPDIGACIPVGSGRAALVLALRALQLPPRAHIGVPLYCCPVVFKAIETANCIPHFIDIDPSNCCLSPSDLYRKKKEIEALIAVHMFGNTCDMKALKEAMGGKPIIEDCAQAIGSKIGGRCTGTFGDVSFFSFRSGKYISAGEGGALFAEDEKIRERLNRLVNDLPFPPHSKEVKHVLLTYVRSKLRRKPLYGILGHRLWKSYNRKADPFAKSLVSVGKIFRSDRFVIGERLLILNEEIQKQRENAAFYEAQLKVTPDMRCDETCESFYNRYAYPLKFDSKKKKDAILKSLLKRQIGAIEPYKEIVALAAKNYDYKGGCPVSEKTARTILAIPCHHRLSYIEKLKIVLGVNESL